MVRPVVHNEYQEPDSVALLADPKVHALQQIETLRCERDGLRARKLVTAVESAQIAEVLDKMSLLLAVDNPLARDIRNDAWHSDELVLL